MLRSQNVFRTAWLSSVNELTHRLPFWLFRKELDSYLWQSQGWYRFKTVLNKLKQPPKPPEIKSTKNTSRPISVPENSKQGFVLPPHMSMTTQDKFQVSFGENQDNLPKMTKTDIIKATALFQFLEILDGF